MSTPENDRPPFLGSWNKLYGLVLIYLTAIILLFAWFSNAFRL
jgi:hypothetical protein